MSENGKLVIKAVLRQDMSKLRLKEIRKTQKVPGVMYSKRASQPIEILEDSLPKKGHTHSSVIGLELDGKVHKTLMREVQVHPLTKSVLHMDFQDVKADDLVTVSVPLIYENMTAEQKKIGDLKKSYRFLSLSGKVKDVPEAFKVDVSHLKENESILLNDIKVPKSLSLKTGKGRNLVLATLGK
jgi:large subunit ribosomal protein L25